MITSESSIAFIAPKVMFSLFWPIPITLIILSLKIILIQNLLSFYLYLQLIHHFYMKQQMKLSLSAFTSNALGSSLV